MFKPLKHPRVRILGGLPIFHGLTGEIVNREGKLYRVQLDTPVEVPDVGTVTSDLWEPQMLKVIKRQASRAPKVIAIDVSAPIDVTAEPVVEITPPVPLAVELPVTEPVTAVPAPLTPEDRLAAAKVPAKVKRAQRRAAAR